MSIWNKIKVYLKNVFTICSLVVMIAGIVLFFCTINIDSISVLFKLLFIGLAVLGGYGMVESWQIMEHKGFKSNVSSKKVNSLSKKRVFRSEPLPNAQEFNEDEIPNCFKKLANKNGTRLNIKINHNTNVQQPVQTQQSSQVQTNNQTVVNQNPEQTINIDEVPNFFKKMIQKSMEDEQNKK